VFDENCFIILVMNFNTSGWKKEKEKEKDDDNNNRELLLQLTKTQYMFMQGTNLLNYLI